MSALRWTGAILLSLLLIPTTCAGLVAMELEGSASDPQFYKDRLRNADFYEFALNDLTAALIREAIRSRPDVPPPLSAADMVASLNRVFPPYWAQAQAESWIDQLVRYMTGRRNRFTVNVQVSDRIPAATDEARAISRKLDIPRLAIDAMDDGELDSMARDLGSLGIRMDRERLRDIASTVFDEAWTNEQADSAIDAVAPYMTGETDGFEFRIDFQDRADAAAAAVKEVLREVDWYALAFDEVVEPIVRDRIGDAVLPAGVRLSSDGIVPVIRSSLPRESFEPVAEDTMEQVSRYVVGMSDHISVAIDLREDKRRAHPLLTDLAVSTFDLVVTRLPPCSGDAITYLAPAGLSGQSAGRIPLCMPAEEPARAEALTAIAALRSSMDDGVEQVILSRVPDRIDLSEQDVREGLVGFGGADARQKRDAALSRIDGARSLMSLGMTFGDEDLKALLPSLNLRGSDPVTQLESVRAFLRDGQRLTERHLLDFLKENTYGGDEWVEIVRLSFSRARWAPLSIMLLALALAAALGMTAGRRARSRLAWGAGGVALSAAVALVLFGPVFDLFGPPAMQDAMRLVIPPADIGSSQRLVTNKAVEIAVDAALSLTRGIALKSAVLLFLAALVTLGATQWGKIIREPDRP